MKKMMKYVITLLLILGCLFSLSTVCLAETSETADSFQILPSEFIAEPKLDIETIIKNKVTEERVNESYKMSSLDMPEKFTYDTSIYLVEYSVSTDYWDDVKTWDYKGLTDALYTDYPTIYIPLFADVADTNGNMHTRVIAYIKLYYNWLKSDYSFIMSTHQVTSEDYKNKKNAGFYENISFYLEENEIDAQQVFLIKYPSSLSTGKETITVIQTESDTLILDLDNTLYVDNDDKMSDRSVVYSISEYKPLRQQVEKEMYKNIITLDDQDNEKNNWVVFLVCGLVIAVILGIIIYFVVKKKRKQPLT